MKKLSWLFVILIIFLVLIFVVRSESASVAKKISIGDRVFKVEVANELVTLTQGLSGKGSLAVDEGMLFIFSDKKIRNFWMKDMNFPIDLIWLDDNIVVGWQENMAIPEVGTKLKKYPSPQPVNRVLEIPANSISTMDIQKGMIINLDI